MTSDRTEHLPRPTHYLIALRPCGCLAVSVADLPGLRAQAAQALADAVMAGLKPNTVAAQRLGDYATECSVCRAAPALIAPPTLYDSYDPRAPRVLVEGTLTYSVQVPVRVVVATFEQNEERIGDLVFAGLTPSTLYASREGTVVEYSDTADDEPLTYAPAPATWPQVVADQSPLPLDVTEGAR